jgi:hypothetical protein
LSTASVEYKILLIGSMFPEKILSDGENYRTNSYNKVLYWIFQNTNELHEQKKEGIDKKSIPFVSVPLTGLFSKPFLKDLDLLWRVDSNVKTCEDRRLGICH